MLIHEALEESMRTLQMELDALPDPPPERPSDDESPVLRRKTVEKSPDHMTEEEVYRELRNICHPGNPKRRFEMRSELGAG